MLGRIALSVAIPLGSAISLLSLFSSPLSWPLAAEILIIGGRERGFEPQQLIGTEIFRSKDASEDIRLKRASHLGSKHNLLYLDFEEESPISLRERSGGFQIAAALYEPTRDALSGSYAATFNSPRQGIRILPGAALSSLQEGFTVELWLKPATSRRRETLLKKSAFLGGSRRGLELYLQNGWPRAQFYNLFMDADGGLHSLTLHARQPLKVGSWQHISFSYDSRRKRLALYLNGEEQEVQRVGAPQGSWQLHISSMDRSPLLLAPAFIGSIDEFRIARRALDPQRGETGNSLYHALKMDQESGRGSQRHGSVVSAILSPDGEEDQGAQGAHIARLRYLAEHPAGTAFDFSIRYSKRPFRPEDPLPPWRRIEGSAWEALDAFSYLQWRARLRSDPLGRKSPILKSVALEYLVAVPLPAPRNLRIVPRLSSGERVCLEWQHDREEEIEREGGYYVHYGLRPGEYSGLLRYRFSSNGKAQLIGRRPIEGAVGGSGRGRLRLVLDNRLISLNLAMDPKRDLPLIQPGLNYYFAVSAYDKERRSPLSQEALYIVPAQD